VAATRSPRIPPLPAGRRRVLRAVSRSWQWRLVMVAALWL